MESIYLKEYASIEQSKKLREIGLPLSTADCYYGMGGIDLITDKPYVRELIIRQNGPQMDDSIFRDDINDTDWFYPSWSVGALIKVIHNCIKNAVCLKPECDISNVEVLIEMISSLSENGYDFAMIHTMKELKRMGASVVNL